MINFINACKIIKKKVLESKKNEYVEIVNSHNRILAKDYSADFNFPAIDTSAMDGAIIFKNDLKKKKFRLVGESKAGEKSTTEFKNNEAKLVYTGAPIPGTNKVVIPFENFNFDNQKKSIFITKKTSKNFIRKKGSDFKKNKKYLLKNNLISIRTIALAKSMKIKTFLVKKKPRVFVILTGDELITKKNPEGTIESSNLEILKLLIPNLGGNIVKIETTRDSSIEIENTFKSCSNFDLLITSGGISKGKYDLVKKTLFKKKLKLFFDQVEIKPGKPTIFGKFTQNKFFLGIPGNPVSCFITTLIFFQKFVDSFYGINNRTIFKKKLKSKSYIPKNNSFTTFLRIKIENSKQNSFSVFPNQDSALQSILNDADGILVRKPFSKEINVGCSTEVILFNRILNIEI